MTEVAPSVELPTESDRVFTQKSVDGRDLGEWFDEVSQ